MESTEPPHRRQWLRNRRGVIAVALSAGVVTIVATAAWFTAGRTEHRPVEILRVQPIQRPHVVEAETAWLPDNAIVLGVRVGNRYRAYALIAFSKIDEHVVNDLVGGVPVTVTYCNRTDCPRVFTDARGSQPLAVAVGGWVGEPGSGPDGVMLLRVDSSYYFQDTGESLDGWGRLPYSEIEFERTTWKTWRLAHPDTDVYTGPRRE